MTFKNKIIITTIWVVVLSLWVALASSLLKNNDIYEINEEIARIESQIIINSSNWDNLEIQRLSIVETQSTLESENNNLRNLKKEQENLKKELGLK